MAKKIKLFLKNLGQIPHQLFYLCLFCAVVFNFVEAYEVQFEGVNDSALLKLIESSSQLEKLKNKETSSLKGLKRRAQNDLVTILQVLQSQAYYDAKVDFKINQEGSLVTVMIQTGPVYPLKVFTIRHLQYGKEVFGCFLNKPISLKDIQVELGKPAFPETIINGEDTYLDRLNLQGYAFAKSVKRDVFVDQLDKSVLVLLVVDIGPLSFFGPLTIKGNSRVRDNYFIKKLRWTEGQLYDPIRLEKTQEVLELSGLFKSLSINKAEQPNANGTIPIEISVIEGKQRSVGGGLSYATDLGPGFTADWEDRNLFGQGERLGFRADMWVRVQKANFTYLIPDFLQQEQNLICETKYIHEQIKAYTESSFSYSAIIERKLSDQLRFSYGGMYTLLRSERSSNNGTFDLVKVPFEIRYTTTDSLLDPTEGVTANLKIIPSAQILSPRFAYSINTFTGTHYHPIKINKRCVFASKIVLGVIVGASEDDIPSPERFYTGSENALRGYRYLTVSPLGGKNRTKPLGGRSLFVCSFELRQRFGENYGIVYFYEFGNVYKNPQLDIFEDRMLQSTGLGFRYYTPIGPLRLDFAFPLTPRKQLDHKLEVYFSIGQTY